MIIIACSEVGESKNCGVSLFNYLDAKIYCALFLSCVFTFSWICLAFLPALIEFILSFLSISFNNSSSSVSF